MLYGFYFLKRIVAASMSCCFLCACMTVVLIFQ